MKRMFVIVLCFVLLLTGCSYESGVTTDSLVPKITQAQTTADSAKSLAEAAKASADGKAPLATVNELTTKVAGLSGSNSYSRAEVDAKFAAYDSQIATMKTEITALKGGSTTGGGTGTVTPTGQITYTIQNPATMGLYQLNTASNISVRIFNNKSEARYIRPQITLTSYNGANSGTVTATATVISNSMGQNPIVFSANAIPAGATTQVLYIAASGGVVNGQYLLASGNQMDILITIQATGTLSSLWNMSVTGSDVSSITGF